MGIIIFDGVGIDKETYTVQQAEKIIAKLMKEDDQDDEIDLIEDYEHD